MEDFPCIASMNNLPVVVVARPIGAGGTVEGMGFTTRAELEEIVTAKKKQNRQH